MRPKLLVAALFASAVGVVMFVASLASFSTDVNVLNLALSNPKDAFSPTLSTLSGTDMGLETTMTSTVTSTLNLTDTNKVAEAITKFFSGTVTTTLTVSDVVGLHNQGWGYGEIFKLYALAQESGMTPDQIKALRDGGMGWGEIAKLLDLSPGNKGNNLGAAVSGRGITETLTTNSKSDDNSHGNPHDVPPRKSGGGGPPPGKGNGKGK